MINDIEDHRPLPPRREKHGKSKNEKVKETEHSHMPINSRVARRQALKELYLNPEGIDRKAKKAERDRPKNKPKKKKKKNGGLIVANIILTVFLIMIVTIFFLIFYNK
ncbi:hypothetical protein ACFO4N_03760 [Camelliibacillus cellulosilyticus]|uniref:Uncharacterized protein n=1 Tax=Camelliibacillus cellulosilyticus TaxID=2174486 RepID=A0ABV9GHU5_9BACL